MKPTKPTTNQSQCAYCGEVTHLTVRKLRNDFAQCPSPESKTGWHKWTTIKDR